MKSKNDSAFVDQEVTEQHVCKFNGACFGVICIDDTLCRKPESELTDADKRSIDQFNNEMNWMGKDTITKEDGQKIQDILDQLPF